MHISHPILDVEHAETDGNIWTAEFGPDGEAAVPKRFNGLSRPDAGRALCGDLRGPMKQGLVGAAVLGPPEIPDPPNYLRFLSHFSKIMLTGAE